MEERQKPGLRTEGVSMLRAIGQFVHYKLTHTAEERWRQLFVCICISALFWTLRMMGKTYTVSQAVGVKWNVKQNGQTIDRALPPASVQTSLSGMGWDLMLTKYHLRGQYTELQGTVVGERLVFNPVQARQAISKQTPYVQVNFVAMPEGLRQ